jgi:hypothetical protein
VKQVFEEIEPFKALSKAKKFAIESGFSVGEICRDAPIGLTKRLEEYISKWNSLSDEERLALDGVIVGDKRNGPVTVFIYEPGDKKII